MTIKELQKERDTNWESLNMLKRELLARAEELSRPDCPEAFGPQEVANFFRQWAGTLDQAMGQIEADQGEISVLRASKEA